MNFKWLGYLAATLLLTSSMALANSSSLKHDSLLNADGGEMFGGLSAGLVTINPEHIYDLTNTGGTMTFNPTTGTLTLTSTITAILAGSQVYPGDFGTITLTTGPLESGSIGGYATFAGGTFTVTTNGTDGLPNGPYLTGVLSTLKWHETGNNNMFYMAASFTGNAGNFGRGNFHEFSTWLGGNNFNVNQGTVAVIPEPNTLCLLATGLIGMIGAARKKAASIVR